MKRMMMMMMMMMMPFSLFFFFLFLFSSHLTQRLMRDMGYGIEGGRMNKNHGS